MGELWVNNGSWNRVENGTDFTYHNGSGYVNPTSVYVYNNGWSEIWKKSDPVTYSFYPWYSSNFRKGSSNNVVESPSTGNDIYIGAISGSFPTHYFSLVSIAGPTTDGTTNISTILATRPNITSASFTLRRRTTSPNGPGVSSPSGSIYFGIFNEPNPWSVGYENLQGINQDWNPKGSGNVDSLSFNTSRTYTIPSQIIYDMVNNSVPMIVAGTTSESGQTGFVSSVSSSTNNYMAFFGSSDPSYKPYWTVTFDY